MWACGRCGARDAAADRVRTVCGPCRAQRWYARVRLFGINASATNWGESRPPTHTMLRKLKGQKAGQLNRHARYRPATVTRYRTKHCHAAVAPLGGISLRKGQLNRHNQFVKGQVESTNPSLLRIYGGPVLEKRHRGEPGQGTPIQYLSYKRA